MISSPVVVLCHEIGRDFCCLSFLNVQKVKAHTSVLTELDFVNVCNPHPLALFFTFTTLLFIYEMYVK